MARKPVQFTRVILGVLLLSTVLAIPTNTVAADLPLKNSEDMPWPQFLGPSRNGISAEMGLLDTWPEDGPREVWRMKSDVSMGGVAIAKGRLLTMTQNDGKQFVVARDAGTGKPIWRTAVALQYRNQMGNGPRATPTISGDQVFVFTGQGMLVALSFEDGQIAWSHNVLKEQFGKPADYGMSCSPLVVGNQVIVTPGAPRASVVAYDTQTGKLAWTTGTQDAACYSSPVLLNVGGKRQVVALTGSSLMGIQPSSGALLWRYPFVTDFGCNTSSPISVNGNVFISSGESHGCAMLSVEKEGDKYNVKEAWSSLGTKSVLRAEWQTTILLDGHLYGMDNVGGAGPITHLTCVEAATGERAWQVRRFGKSNLIAADGKLFISTMKGELIVVRANAEKYDEIGRAVVIGRTRQAPALAHGLLYLRDNQEIVCLDVRKR